PLIPVSTSVGIGTPTEGATALNDAPALTSVGPPTGDTVIGNGKSFSGGTAPPRVPSLLMKKPRHVVLIPRPLAGAAPAGDAAMTVMPLSATTTIPASRAARRGKRNT